MPRITANVSEPPQKVFRQRGSGGVSLYLMLHPDLSCCVVLCCAVLQAAPFFDRLVFRKVRASTSHDIVDPECALMFLFQIVFPVVQDSLHEVLGSTSTHLQPSMARVQAYNSSSFNLRSNMHFVHSKPTHSSYQTPCDPSVIPLSPLFIIPVGEAAPGWQREAVGVRRRPPGPSR